MIFGLSFASLYVHAPAVTLVWQEFLAGSFWWISWIELMYSDRVSFGRVFKPESASPRSLVHRLSKRQQPHQLHLNLRHTLDDLPGLAGRTDNPDSWRTRLDALQEPVEDYRGGELDDEALLRSEYG